MEQKIRLNRLEVVCFFSDLVPSPKKVPRSTYDIGIGQWEKGYNRAIRDTQKAIAGELEVKFRRVEK